MKRKMVTMLVTVSVPADMTATEARREVRSAITHQAYWSAEDGDLKALKVAPAPKIERLTQKVGELHEDLRVSRLLRQVEKGEITADEAFG